MKFLDSLVRSPVTVAVGVLLLSLFGTVALTRMPLQLTPEVQTPTISIRTDWPGASPQEFEREIIDRQEDFLKSVEGVTKISSSSYGPAGRITLEFAVGTNMNEALLKVNSQLQQVPDYPEEVDEPVITTSNFSDRPIAWFVLSPRPPEPAEYEALLEEHPELAEQVESARSAPSNGLELLRLQRLAAENEAFRGLLPSDDLNLVAMRRFVEDNIEARFERVKGVARADVSGGLEDELQVVVDQFELAARNLTILDVRDALRGLNDNVPGGYFDEGKRRWFVRTLGRFESPEQVEGQLLAVRDGKPIYVRDVADVRLGLKDPSGLVRRFSESSIAVSVIREHGANVLDVMKGLRVATAELNEGPLQRQGLQLTQLYDETEYIYSALDLVQSNIFVGGALTMIVLMSFLHLSVRTMLIAPLIIASALAATYITPWFFVLTLVLVVAAGVWFARGALVVGLAIPTCIVGTFLMMNIFGRSLNVISLAGLAFAIGMLVDNAVVVLENIYRHYSDLDEPPITAAVRGAQEVWGAVLASTLTTVAVFLPVVFIQEEAGQLFRDIALAITAAIGLSLLVSVTVIPTAAAWLFRRRGSRRRVGASAAAQFDQNGRAASGNGRIRAPRLARLASGRVVRATGQVGGSLTSAVVNFNAWIQGGLIRRLTVVGVIVSAAIGLSWALWPQVEYLPTGNRNMIVGMIRPPIGYNYDEMMEMGAVIEENLAPYWDVNAADGEEGEAPAIADFFYVVDTYRVFLSVKARNPARAAELIEPIRRAAEKVPGTFVSVNQASLFEQRMSGGRSIDIEISGPDLDKLRDMGYQTMDILADADPDTPGEQPLLPGGQAFANPELDMNSPELLVRPKPFRANENELPTTDLGYIVDALVDGAYAGDYYHESDRIDLVIKGQEAFAAHTHDIERLSTSTPSGMVIPLEAVADVVVTAGPEQIDHREAERAISIGVTPPADIPLQEAMQRIREKIVAPLYESGQLSGPYRIELAGTADKLRQAWDALWFNLMLALLITYLLMASLFESWLYPLVIIFSVPLGAVGGVLGLNTLNVYLGFLDAVGVHGIRVQQLDVLTMLGFVILIGSVVNNPILIVHQSLNHMRNEGMPRRAAILESLRTRIRPIFMTTTTTVLGLLPLVLFPGAGSELYRGLGSVLLGGLVVSTLFTLILVPTLFSLAMDLRDMLATPHEEEWPGESDAVDTEPAPELVDAD